MALTVVSFGKLVNKMKNEYPMFPDLHILVFKETEENPIYTHTAVCIEFELDVCGNSAEEVQSEIGRAIKSYLEGQAYFSSSLEEFAQRVIDALYSPSKQKEKLFEIYQNAERDSFMSRWEKESKTQAMKPLDIVPFLFGEEAAFSLAMAL